MQEYNEEATQKLKELLFCNNMIASNQSFHFNNLFKQILQKIDEGANPNIKGNVSPLWFFTIQQRDLVNAETVLEKGANPNQEPSMFADLLTLEQAQLFKAHGATFNSEKNLLIAVATHPKYDSKLIPFYISQRVDIKNRLEDLDGDTMLHRLARNLVSDSIDYQLDARKKLHELRQALLNNVDLQTDIESALQLKNAAENTPLDIAPKLKKHLDCNK